MKIERPTTSADAIRAVCYVRAWRVRRLAEEIGTSESHLSDVVRGKSKGSDALVERILAHMPPGAFDGEPGEAA